MTENTASTTQTSTGEKAKGSRVGEVATAGRDKTIKVVVSYVAKHPKYGKYVRRRTVLHAHDEGNVAQVGDRVEVVPCRPMSKTKSWRLSRIVEQRRGE
ncbi:MAG: 30S ribosomal protein S17 [Phycisphaeraceae bacterium]|nr:30S ribosomal protein S17 [Phycisphaeraceae bacterium]